MAEFERWQEKRPTFKPRAIQWDEKPETVAAIEDMTGVEVGNANRFGRVFLRMNGEIQLTMIKGSWLYEHSQGGWQTDDDGHFREHYERANLDDEPIQ